MKHESVVMKQESVVRLKHESVVMLKHESVVMLKQETVVMKHESVVMKHESVVMLKQKCEQTIASRDSLSAKRAAVLQQIPARVQQRRDRPTENMRSWLFVLLLVLASAAYIVRAQENTSAEPEPEVSATESTSATSSVVPETSEEPSGCSSMHNVFWVASSIICAFIIRALL
ncbi:uncharacterized protein LOC121389070 [Gigantopelta aegis]|uniref:uncharacterized protein LOC121389070 n=1 Tax=Gigantopelta aegis TaxID=1735272 RepID=UPI001B889904|nr:uncharacterized protein LOC121389070 [Gigantopelta aegis]